MTPRKARNPEFIFLTPERRLAANLRALQKLVREKIDPEGTMTDAEYVDRSLAIVDSEDVNAALDALDKDLDKGFDPQDFDGD